MSIDHEELVAFALNDGSQEERERVQSALESDPALAAEFREIVTHLSLHDAVPVLEPPPVLQRQIRTRIEEESVPVRRPVLARYWPSVAAAALVVVAFLVTWASKPSLETIRGPHSRTADGGLRSHGLVRVDLGRLVVTLDANTEIAFLDSQRLALRAGRAFFEVAPKGRGFVVTAGGVEVTTTGTAFLVDARNPTVRVAVTSGSVDCSTFGTTIPVTAGESRVFGEGFAHLNAEPIVAWFETPSFVAEIRGDNELVMIIKNETFKTLTIPAPTGGDPMFIARYAGRDRALSPVDPLKNRPVPLHPGEELTLKLRLPEPIANGEALSVSCRPWNVRVTAKEAR